MPKIEHLKILENFLYNNIELEKIEEKLDEFNIFSALNISDNEIRHSNFLSWLLDPKETHNLGSYFLEAFLKEITINASDFNIQSPSIVELDILKYDDFEIQREWKNIDIVIKSDINRIIYVIENKVHSTEHSNQLKRYREIITKSFSNYNQVYVYLTLDGSEPSDENYIPISYRNIIKLIKKILDFKKNNITHDVFVFINNYNEMLKRHLMKESEIQELCNSIYKKHKKAIDLIFEYKSDQIQLISSYAIEYLKSKKDIIVDHEGRTQVMFLPKELDSIPKQGLGWTKSGRILLYVISLKPTTVDLYLYIGPGDNTIRDVIYKTAMKNKKLFNVVNRQKGLKWHSIYKYPIFKISKIEDLEEEDIKNTFYEKLDKFYTSDMLEINKVIKDIVVNE